MQYTEAKITKLLVDFFEDDFRRIDHAQRVLFHSKNIAIEYASADLDVVIACALLHDVGIKPAETKFGYNNGKLQEEYGPAIAEELLQSIDFPAEAIVKVKEIIGNHHSPSRYNYVELEILKEADAIVNKADSLEVPLT
jgi:HD superfamily phosphodiesterase